MRAADTGERSSAAPEGASRPGLSGIARGGALNLLGAGVSATTGVLLVVVVTRTLPQREAGVFFALTSVFLIVQMLAGLGTSTGLVYFIARLRSLGLPGRIRALQRVAIAPVVALSVAAAVLLVVWAPSVSRLVGGPPGDTDDAVAVLALLLPLAVLSDFFLATTRGYATMVPTVAIDRFGRSLLQFGLVALAVGGGSVVLLAAAWAVPWLASALVAGWLVARLGRTVPAPSPGAGDTTPPWREFWRFTAPRAGASVAQLVLQRFDIILVSVLIGPAAAAVYTAATRFLVIGQLASTAIANAAQPRLAALIAQEQYGAVRQVYQSATAWIVALTWPLYLLCAVFADAVLAIFGEGYEAGRPVVLVLAGAMLLSTACGMVDMLLNMAGRTSWTLANAVVAVAVMIGLDLLLIPRIGILGAGIGWAAAIAVNNLLPLSQLLHVLRLHPFGRATVSFLALATACFGALPVAARWAAPDGLLVPLAAVGIGTVAYVAACWRWRAALGLPALSGLRPRKGRHTAPPDPSRRRQESNHV